MFSPETIQAMREHAIKAYPEESCGYVLGGVYTPCKNSHPNPTKFFRIDPRTMAAARKRCELQAIIHSHPDGPFGPSLEDQEGQIASGVPWGVIYSRPDSASVPTWFGVGAPHQPLVGRQFLHGVNDCYTLVRHYYQDELGIILPEMARPELWWTKPGYNFYLDGANANGFVQVDKLQKHDVILMNIRSEHGAPNHAAVYLGGDSILHHLMMRNSYQDDEGVLKWKRHIHSYWRHQSQIKE